MKTMTSGRPSIESSRASGFTLIEVVISLTIMAAIATLAFSGLSIGLDSWDRGTKQIEKLDERAMLERLLARQLALAAGREFRASPQDQPFVLFRGSSDRVEFVSNYSLANGPSDFRKIGYRFDGQSFRYEEKQLFGYVPLPAESVDGQSIATIRSMRFRFLKREKDQDSWTDNWQYGDGLPAAVEVWIENDRIVIPLVNKK